MGRRSYAAVPNRLIEDCSLKHTTKRIAVALLMENRRRNGCIRISLEDLAKRSGCGVSTVQKGLRELTAHGYVTQERNSYYSLTLGRRIYSKNTYRMERISGGYTLVPRSALRRRGKRGRPCQLLRADIPVPLCRSFRPSIPLPAPHGGQAAWVRRFQGVRMPGADHAGAGTVSDPPGVPPDAAGSELQLLFPDGYGDLRQDRCCPCRRF